MPAHVDGTELWLCLFGLELSDAEEAGRLAEAMVRCEPACVLLAGRGAEGLARALGERAPGTRTRCVEDSPEAAAALFTEELEEALAA